ncbi:hypothetical protein ACIP93_01015 [Streptomyces sp. NPDC088745]|uniref:hypothetical protein n=1 Tax=Streptomyces sp. NPDC088745 TaxID=3365884 RepID=UPI0037F6A788
MTEQQRAAIAQFKSIKQRAASGRTKPKHRPGCPGRGFVVMAAATGPVTVPCVCCGGGGSE